MDIPFYTGVWYVVRAWELVGLVLHGLFPGIVARQSEVKC
jgi:hypothetical protein